MGMGTYREFKSPMHGRINYVATTASHEMLPGFEIVHDVPEFIAGHSDELINIIGGAGLFTSTLDFADELRLTHIEQDFHCTKFFPEYKQYFELKERSQPTVENGITYRFETWRRK